MFVCLTMHVYQHCVSIKCSSFVYTSETRIVSMCGSVSATSTGQPLYIENFAYPSNAIHSSDTSCSCSVEANSCFARINVYFVHFQLSEVGGCRGSQKIMLNDDGTVHDYTCSNNTGYEITSILTSSSNYLTVTLDNPDGVAGGYFWMAFEGEKIHIFDLTRSALRYS